VHPGPMSVNDEGTSKFEVDYIVDSRPIGRGFQYLVHWKGYDESDHTWEPASRLKNAQATVNDFYRRQSSAPCRLKMNQALFDSLFSNPVVNFTSGSTLPPDLESQD
jgi:hypothetical protein